MEDPLTAQEKRFLLELARRTLEARLAGVQLTVPTTPEGRLRDRGGAFVTLTHGGELRGCIGHVEGFVPLWQSVHDNAVAAALQDPRFSPLDLSELPEVSIEISVMGPLVEVRPEQVEVGRHGVVVRRGFARGLLLPQVAVEQGWDREELLDFTCRKAGLAPGCWRSPDARLYAFTAEVFSEKEMENQGA